MKHVKIFYTNLKCTIGLLVCDDFVFQIYSAFFVLLGKSKIFLKYYHAEQLTHLHSEMMKAIVTIQSYIRMRIARLRIRNPIFEELSRHPKFSQVR